MFKQIIKSSDILPVQGRQENGRVPWKFTTFSNKILKNIKFILLLSTGPPKIPRTLWNCHALSRPCLLVSFSFFMFKQFEIKGRKRPKGNFVQIFKLCFSVSNSNKNNFLSFLYGFKSNINHRKSFEKYLFIQLVCIGAILRHLNLHMFDMFYAFISDKYCFISLACWVDLLFILFPVLILDYLQSFPWIFVCTCSLIKYLINKIGVKFLIILVRSTTNRA